MLEFILKKCKIIKLSINFRFEVEINSILGLNQSISEFDDNDENLMSIKDIKLILNQIEIFFSKVRNNNILEKYRSQEKKY